MLISKPTQWHECLVYWEELDEERKLTERSDWNDDKGLKHDGEKWKINEMDEMLSYKTKPVTA